MSGTARRTAALTAALSLVAVVALGSTPVRAGIAVGATVTITKVTDPAIDADDFEFSNIFLTSPITTNVLDTDPTSASTPSSYQFSVTDVDFGYLYVAETKPSDWTLTDIQCTGDADVSYNVDGYNVSLQVGAGENISCTFYNTKRAQLEVRKETLPGNDPQDFYFGLTTPSVAGPFDLDTDPNSAFTNSSTGWSIGPDDLGAYVITESATTGWLLIDLTCTGAGSDSSVNVGTSTATLDIDAGELVQCTFTNAKLPLVTITKVTVPASDPQDFYLEIPGDVNTTLDTDPGSEGVPNSETFSFAGGVLGPRNIQETAVAGWTLTDITCTEGSATATDLEAGSVTIDLQADSNIECTFTNTKDADPTDPPPTDDPTVEPTVEPTADSGGETDAATEPGTSTEGPGAEPGSTIGPGVALLALLLLTGALLVTRPKRAR